MVNIYIESNKNRIHTTNRFVARKKAKEFKGYSCDLVVYDKKNDKNNIVISICYIRENLSLVNALDIADYYIALKGVKDFEYAIYVREWGVL